MIKYYLIILNLFALFFIASAQSPHEQGGSASVLFLRADLGPRPSALSGSFTAIANDEHALFYNPAGLANITHGAVGLNHVQWFEDIRMDNIVVGYSFHRRLGMALSFSHLWMPSIQGKDQYGQNTEKIDVSTSILNIGFGYRFHQSFYGGLGVKYFSDNLAGYKVNGTALDAGLYMFTFLRGLTLGTSVQNIGGQVKYDRESEQLPLTYRAGLAYKVQGSDLRAAIDAVKSTDSHLFISAGVEYEYKHFLAVRLGNLFQNQSLLEPSFGLGMIIARQYVIDYAFYKHAELGMTHKIGITFNFKLAPEVSTVIEGKPTTAITLKPPQYVSGEVDGDKLLLKWSSVSGAQYNVYARTSKNEAWRKISSSPLYSNQHSFKKPLQVNLIYIAVSSVIGEEESALSKEVVIHVR